MLLGYNDRHIKMNSTRETDIKNCSYYFVDDIISMNNLDSNKTKIDKKSYKNILTYYIGYLTPNKIKRCNEERTGNSLFYTSFY